MPWVPCPVYVRPRPPLPAVAIASNQADSSIQITKPHRVTNQNSESQMSRSSRFIVGARFGEVPTLVRVQRCGLGRPPSTCARPTARPRWLCWWRSTTPRRAVQSNMLGRLLLLNAAAARAVSFTLSPRLIIFSPKAEITPDRDAVGSEHPSKRKQDKRVVSGHCPFLPGDVGLAAGAGSAVLMPTRTGCTPSCYCGPMIWVFAPHICALQPGSVAADDGRLGTAPPNDLSSCHSPPTSDTLSCSPIARAMSARSPW